MQPIAQKQFLEYSHILKDDGIFPNSILPVLLYKNVLDFPLFFDAAYTVNLFEKNNWHNGWKNGLAANHQYHSNTHAVIGVYKGATTVLLGGEKGVTVSLEKGDVLVIPAGVAYKNIGKEHAVCCVGAFSESTKADLFTGLPQEKPIADINIAAVPLPNRDPVLGLKGGTEKYWK